MADSSGVASRSRWRVAAVPFAVSLGLSGLTVGRELYWQDSGFFLCAVRELAVLYPPGFVLYEILCKLWTTAFSFLDFTLSVHLFSSFCGASACAALSLACADFLKMKSSPLRPTDGTPDSTADWVGMTVGCVAASGYTFWMAAIYAKGYSFFYLVLALLLWRMIRAAESRKPGDFTIVAILIGLAWQAHPSASAAGACLLSFVVFHRQSLGWKGVGWRAGVAAVAALGPVLLLPALAKNNSAIGFGAPASVGDLVDYLVAKRFVSRDDAFGWSAVRWRTASQFFWEEFLGVTLIVLVVGLISMAREKPRSLPGILLWVLPYTAVTSTFTLEGQHDHWYVAAWMPLFPVCAVGLARIGKWAGSLARPAVSAVGAAALAWGIAANFRDLQQRGNKLPELLGRVYLERLAPRAVLITTSDDGTGSTHYLQILRDVRRDVLLVRPGHLNAGRGGRPGWYDLALQSRDPGLPTPDYEGTRRRLPGRPKLAVDIAAFANAVVSPERPVYLEEPVPADMIRPDYVLVPSGALMKLVPRGRERIDRADWTFPIEPERVRALFRRARGLSHEKTPEGERIDQEPFERRLFIALLRARLYLAEWDFRHGEPAAARTLYASILAADAETARLVDVVYPLGVCTFLSGDRGAAKPILAHALTLDLPPRERAFSLFYLGEISRSEGREADASQFHAAAIRVPGLDPAVVEELRRRLAPN